jgi:hypothetical protein
VIGYAVVNNQHDDKEDGQDGIKDDAITGLKTKNSHKINM